MTKRKKTRPLIRPKSRTDLAWEYGISPRTLYRRLMKEGIELPAGRILPIDLRRIYRKLGRPPFTD